MNVSCPRFRQGNTSIVRRFIYNLKRYNVFTIGGFERLIRKVNQNVEGNFKIYVFLEEI